MTPVLSAEEVVTPDESVTLAVAVTVPVLGKILPVNPISVGLTVRVVSPTGFSIVRLTFPILTVTDVALGSILVIVIFFSRPPCPVKSFLTVGAFGVAISDTLSVRVVSSLYRIVTVSPVIVTFLIRPSTPCACLILAIKFSFSVSVGLLKSLTKGLVVGLRLAFLTARLA